MGEGNLTEKARLFAARMDLGAYQEAAKIKADYSLPDDMLQESVRRAFDANIKKGEYSIAADLAKKYSLPQDLRLDAAMRSFQRKIDHKLAQFPTATL